MKNTRKQEILNEMGEISLRKKELTVKYQALYAEYKGITAAEKLNKLSPAQITELLERAKVQVVPTEVAQ